MVTPTERISALRAKHAKLEEEIEEEQARPLPDTGAIRHLKRRKLAIKDEIATLERV